MNDDAGLALSRFSPSFPVPGSLSQSLPPTEKLHQIIARTAMFVSRHGGQSEIVLRVKQGDNPTFGFLMPDHDLHAYFRYLVDHPELLHFDIDGNSQNEMKKAGSDHNDIDRLGGVALSLLGSVYGSGEEDGDDNAETGKEVSGETTNAVDKTISHGSLKTESCLDSAGKDEAVSKNPLSNKSKVLAVKKNSSIGASKPGKAGGTKKKVDSHSSSIDAEKSKGGSALGVTSKVEPVVLEPPSDLKRLIDKIVELIMKYGKQFEATILEQDCNKERFLFLLPSNLYHPYYLKVLQKAQESKVNGEGFHFGKDDPVGRGMEKKASVLEDGDSSSLGYDIPFEFDRKEKFKMTIGKSKKDTQETECRGTQQEFGVTVDAAAAAAILQAATRGIKNPNLGIISGTTLNANHCHNSEDNQASSLGSRPFSQPHVTTEKSDRNGGHNVSVPATRTVARTAALEAAGEADSSEAHLTKEQKLKTERLKRAKMFVAMLKSGAVPFKTGTSRGSSLEPQESGLSKSACEVNLTGKQREGSSAPVDVDKLAIDEKLERHNFGEEHNERVSRRNYRSRSWEHVDEDENGDENGDKEEHNERYLRRKYRSNPGRHEKDDLYRETEMKHSRKKHHSHSSSLEDGEKSEEDRDHKHSKRKQRSRSSPEDEEDYEDRERDDKDRKRSRKKHRSRHSSREHSRKRSKRYSIEEDDEEKRHHRHSGRRHHSHRSRCNRRHKEKHSSKEIESRDHTKDDDSSDEHKMASYIERDDELEEGEISSKASDDSRGIASSHVCRETSLDVSNLFRRAPSQPLEGTTEVSDDLRAKIRAMLMANRS
ncbi:protein suppressor of white apricot-like isoform X2 [Olea europaea var. sylvestris]|nr:protein suppressor of white apricot-like isoform X2 [Olea europaea var. sylvestris]XP_022867412.1 protein suppressor of white apricot-like isoform X2 [Olea europaea var. sylvestris]XP_022867414.1 protein suppressor of white apricot-like isoform X2 [Olea europaea var. sylvestris]